MTDFYDQLTPFYHLIYGDWQSAIATQATQLKTIIQKHWGQVQSILDVSCGIGTQAIGLASQGYSVTASDLSPREIERAKQEAQSRGLDIHFSVCDMRQVYQHHQTEFDLVISCDNSIPHLLDDEEILTALREMYRCTRLGGGCLISLRDYEQEPRGKGIVKPYGIREEAGQRYLVFQVWDFEGDVYDLALYLIQDDRQSPLANTHVMRSRYYAISPNHLMQLMKTVGFTDVSRIDDHYFQPVLVGTRSTNL
jgi:SAM-dependent methyltransferase